MFGKWQMLALSALLAVPAAAAEQSPEAIVRSVDEAFVRHLEAGDVKGILSLYADDADVIWPGEKDEAYDKKALEPMVRDFVAAMKNGKLVQKKVQARWLGKNHVVNSGHWEETSPGPGGKPETHTLRTTEIFEKKGDKWVFVVDHASRGEAEAPATGGAAH